MSRALELTVPLEYKKHKLTIDGKYDAALRDVVPEKTWDLFCVRTNDALEASRKKHTGTFEECVEAFFSLGALAVLGGFWLIGNRAAEIGAIVLVLSVPLLLVGLVLLPFLRLAQRRWIATRVEDALQDTAQRLMDDCRGTGLAVELQRGAAADAPWAFVLRVDAASLEALPAYRPPLASAGNNAAVLVAPPAADVPTPGGTAPPAPASGVLIPGLEPYENAEQQQPPTEGTVDTLPSDVPQPTV